MFIETHSDLAFIKSFNVQVYPSGRRRSTAIDTNNNSETVDDQYNFLFDPEARLNTEANSRKISGLNGFTQTYLKEWDSTNMLLTLSLAGYLFTVTLDENYSSASKFGDTLQTLLYTNAKDEVTAKRIEAASSLYANILIEKIPLVVGTKNYYTSVLRNQSTTEDPVLTLDLPATAVGNDYDKLKDLNNYYFSGLSFSVDPLTAETNQTRSDISSGDQRTVSLRILEKVNDDTWQIHQPAYLPKITHGSTTDSVVVGDLTVARTETNNGISTEGSITVEGNIDVDGNISIDNDVITKNANVSGTISAETDLGENNFNIVANKVNVVEHFRTYSAHIEGDAYIETADITTLSSKDIRQKIGEDDDAAYYNVPVMFIEKDENSDSYQLKLKRVNKVNF